MSRAAPGPVTVARVLMGVVAAVHLTVLLVTLHSGPASLGGSVQVRAVIVHGALFPATAVLAWKLATGHRLALRPATATQVFGITFCTVSTPHLAILWWVIPAECLLGLGILWLLWGSRRARRYFTKIAGERRLLRSSAAPPASWPPAGEAGTTPTPDLGSDRLPT